MLGFHKKNNNDPLNKGNTLFIGVTMQGYILSILSILLLKVV